MFTLLRIIGMPPGSMQPTQVQIVGSFSCPSGKVGIPVELRITAPMGGPVTTFSQQTSTGAPGTPPIGSVVFYIPAWTAAVCGGKIEFDVRGDCGNTGQPQWTQWQHFGDVIECLCPRISLQASYGVCSGSPSKQTITLMATILLPPNVTSQFTWEVKDRNNHIQNSTGAIGGSLTNTTNSWNTPLTLTTTYDLDPSQGPYTACLSSPECPSACITLRPNCNVCCDEVIVNINTQPLPCIPSGGGSVPIQFSASLLPSGCTGPFEWKVTDAITNTVLQPFTPGSSAFSYPFASAGTYRVAVRVQQASTCDDPVLTDSCTFSLVACADCPTLEVTVQVSGCSSNSPSVALNVILTGPNGTITPPTGTTYHWTIDDKVSNLKAQRSGLLAAVNTTSGWVGTLATSTGAVDLSRPGDYSLSVHADIPGADASCDPTDSAIIHIPPCRCPAPIPSPNQEWTVTGITAPFGPNSFQTIICGTAAINLSLAVDPGDYQPGDLFYSWDFGDGSPIITGQGPGSASQTHTFTNPNQNQSRIYTVTVTISVPGSTCPPFSRTATITVPACNTQICPSVSQVSPDRVTDCINPGTSVTFNFTAAITNPGTVTGGFRWDFGDGTTPQTTSGPSASHTYNSTGTFTVSLTVNGPAASNCPPSTQTTAITITSCTNGQMNAGCWILLLAALVLGVIASILGIIAGCSANPYVGIAAAIVGVVALALLILWLIFCARNNCAIFNWARWIVIWILMIAPIVGIIVGIIGNPICGIIATGILWGYWGLVLAILDIAGPKIGCPLSPPPFP